MNEYQYISVDVLWPKIISFMNTKYSVVNTPVLMLTYLSLYFAISITLNQPHLSLLRLTSDFHLALIEILLKLTSKTVSLGNPVPLKPVQGVMGGGHTGHLLGRGSVTYPMYVCKYPTTNHSLRSHKSTMATSRHGP